MIHYPKAICEERGRPVHTHLLIAERALGKRLPKGAQVHHVNEDKRDNSPGNLVICQDRAFHMLLHVRARIKRAGGNPNTDKVCCRCHQALPRDQFYVGKGMFGRTPMCKPCCKARIRKQAKETSNG